MTDPDLDVQALRVVRAIADAGSLTAAAAQLGYSQPALSQQMRRLEQRLGVAVVERAGRRLRLTEAGRILARHAPAVTTALDAAAGELAALRGLHQATVRLVGFPSASPTVVPPLVARLARTAPGITLTYVEAEPPEAVAAVREDRADIALTFSYPGDPHDPHGASARGLAVADVGADELLLVLPAGHPRAGVAPPRLADFADDDWIAGCPRCRGHLLAVCGRAGFTPRIAFETDNIAAVESLVAHGTGVATLPRLAVASFPPLPGIHTVPLAHGRTLHAVTARGAERVPAVAVVLAAVREAVAAATVGGAPAA
ncbi:LysR family transcriptional regulator [Microbacterium sp. W1N]|uniref:LysR family transcriptional regulator n=1 Tax=Microbacterium festucae TaxID=2977531 RepID=UPI0021C007A4|nr:LysR family transcriptional regulator [Microbacterium festucae]MCT9820362.1 LysR family transcriptional regulator [Microbacterium festucae]